MTYLLICRYSHSHLLSNIQYSIYWSFVEKTSAVQDPNPKWVQNFRWDIPPIEASGGQDQYFVRSSWHLEECNWEGRGQTYPPVEASGGQEWYELPMYVIHCNAGEWVLLFSIYMSSWIDQYMYVEWSVYCCYCQILSLQQQNYTWKKTRTKRFNLHICSIQWSLMQSFCTCCYCVILLLQQ